MCSADSQSERLELVQNAGGSSCAECAGTGQDGWLALIEGVHIGEKARALLSAHRWPEDLATALDPLPFPSRDEHLAAYRRAGLIAAGSENLPR